MNKIDFIYTYNFLVLRIFLQKSCSSNVGHIGKSFNMSKLLLLSLEDYARTVFHFKDVLFNMVTREVSFLGITNFFIHMRYGWFF